MKNSVELLDEIIEKVGDEWKKYLDLYLKQEEDSAEGASEYTEIFSEFIDAYKEDILDNKRDFINQIEKKINNDLLSGNLKNYMEKLLEAYNAINPLRVLDVQDFEMAKKLVDFVFDQVILRFNPDAKDNYKKFGLEKEEEMASVMGVLDSLCTFIISHNLHKSAIGEVIRFNTRLSKELSGYVAEVIDQNFEKIQMKIIVEKLFQRN